MTLTKMLQMINPVFIYHFAICALYNTLQDRKLIATAEQMLSESKRKIEVIRMQILQLKNKSTASRASSGDISVPSGMIANFCWIAN